MNDIAPLKVEVSLDSLKKMLSILIEAMNPEVPVRCDSDVLEIYKSALRKSEEKIVEAIACLPTCVRGDENEDV